MEPRLIWCALVMIRLWAACRKTSVNRTTGMAPTIVYKDDQPVLVLGSPGKVVRQLSADEIIGIKGFADYYVQRFKLYRSALKAEP